MQELAADRPRSPAPSKLAPQPDTSGFSEEVMPTSATKTDLRLELKRSTSNSPAPSTERATEVPTQVQTAIDREAALILDRSTRDEIATFKTPLSPQVRDYLREHPGAAHHFALPLGEFRGVGYAGKVEHERATELLDKLNASAERLLDFHAAGINYNSLQFRNERARSISLANQLGTLTGDHPIEVGHTKFTNQQNREKWTEEFKRLQGTLEKAAFRVQDKQLAFLSKNEVTGQTPWLEGVKLDQGAYNRFVGTVSGLTKEGKDHPIVQAHQAEQREKMLVSKVEQEKKVSQERAAEPLPSMQRNERSAPDSTAAPSTVVPRRAPRSVAGDVRAIDDRGAMADADVNNITARVDKILYSDIPVSEKNAQLDKVRALIRRPGEESSPGSNGRTYLRSNFFVIQETPLGDGADQIRSFKLHALPPRIENIPAASLSKEARDDAYMAGFNKRLAALASADVDQTIINKIHSDLTSNYYSGGVAVDRVRYRVIQSSTQDYGNRPCIQIERRDGVPLEPSVDIKTSPEKSPRGFYSVADADSTRPTPVAASTINTQVQPLGELATTLLTIAAARERLGPDVSLAENLKNQEINRITLQALKGQTPLARGQAEMQLIQGSAERSPGTQQLYESARALLATSEKDAPTELATFERAAEIRRYKNEWLKETAKNEVQVLAEAAAKGSDALKTRLKILNEFSDRLTPIERREFAGAIREAFSTANLPADVEKNVGKDSFKKPITENGPTPEALAHEATTKVSAFVETTLTATNNAPPALFNGLPAAHLWNAASSEQDQKRSQAVIRRELGTLFELGLITNADQVDGVIRELKATVGKSPPADTRYNTLMTTLTDYADNIREDGENIRKIWAEIKSSDSDKSSTDTTEVLDPVKKAFGDSVPAIEDLKRYSTRLEATLNRQDLNPAERKNIQRLLREISVSELNMLAP